MQAPIAVTTVEVANIAPTASLSGPNDGYQGVRCQTRTYVLSASDPAAPDEAAGFTYTVDWGDGSALETFNGPSGTQAGHAFEATGTYLIRVIATDKDGGVSAEVTQSAAILATEVQGARLAVGGTGTDDQLLVAPSGTNAALTLNGTVLGTMALPAEGLQFYAGPGNDRVILNGTSSADLMTITQDSLSRGAIRVSGESVETRQVNGLGGNDTISMLSGTAVIDGGTGTDRLTGADVPNLWMLTGTNAGTLNGFAFSNVENLTGGAVGDIFSFVGTGSVSGRIDGGGGINSLDYSARSTAVSVNLASLTATGTAGISNIESLVGSSATGDTLTGPAAASTWQLTAAGAGDVNGTFRFEGIENLTGGSQPDSFRFLFPADTGTFGTINGGSGSDALDYSGSGDPVTVNLRTRTASGLTAYSSIESFIGSGVDDDLYGTDANTTWTINALNAGSAGSTAFSSFERLHGGLGADNFRLADVAAAVSNLVDGGSGNDTLTAAAVANVWRITGTGAGDLNGLSFAGLENLTGSSATDEFLFSGTQCNLAGTINGGSGTDVLDHTGVIGGVTVDLQNRTTSRLGAYLSIERIQGSAAGTDTLIGPDATTTWTISGVDSGTAGSVPFVSFEELRGGSGNDTFTLANTAASVSGSMTGGEGTDSLLGPGTASAWTISNVGAGTLNTSPFADIENLTGGSAADSFAFADNGEISGIINGGGGTDSLSYAAVAGPVTMELATRIGPRLGSFTSIESIIGTTETTDLLVGANATNAWSVTGWNSGTVAGTTFAGFENLLGGTGSDTFTLANPTAGVTGLVDGDGGTDTLVGTAATATWLIDSAGGGVRVDGATSAELNFANIENLTGGSAADTFVLADGAITGVVNGGTGSDLLDYSQAMGPIAVNLQFRTAPQLGSFTSIESITATADAGDLLTGANATNAWSITGPDAGIVGTTTFAGFENLLGGTGADTFTMANAAASVSGLIDGDGGTDTLVGRGNRQRVADRFSRWWSVDSPSDGRRHSLCRTRTPHGWQPGRLLLHCRHGPVGGQPQRRVGQQRLELRVLDNGGCGESADRRGHSSDWSAQQHCGGPGRCR